MNAPAAPPPPAGGALGWVRSREGKIVLGAGAVLVVVMLALRRGAGAGGFTAQPQQGEPDGTLQDQLDQLSGRGGTLDELGANVSGLTGSVDHLTDLIEAQNPANSPSSTTTQLGRLGAVRSSYLEQIRSRVAARNRLLAQPRTSGNVAKIHQLEGQLRPLQRAVGVVNEQIRRLQGGS